MNQKYAVRDLFKKKDLGVFDKEFSAFVDIDGVVVVHIEESKVETTLRRQPWRS